MEDYHDYVIKDGRFIGRFEEMYQRFGDPWRQSEQPNGVAREAAIQHMRRLGVRSVVEFGSGLGYYSDRIHRAGIAVEGVDLSPTAVAKARERFPHIPFRTGTVLEELERPIAADAILFAEIGWYILEDFARILDLLAERHTGKLFVNNLVFYKGSQRYGTDMFTDLKGYIARVPFTLLAWTEIDLPEEATIGTTALFRI